MDREDKDSIKNDYIDKLLQKIYGYTDEQILKDFEEAEKDDDSYPDFQVYPDEFDRIWEDIQAERAARTENKPEKEGEEETAATVVELPRKARKIRWKRVAIAGVAACLVTLSVCFVAVGKKSYFYRERGREGVKDNQVYNNDFYVSGLDNVQQAYNKIEEDLSIDSLKIEYMPENMEFLKLTVIDGYAVMEFQVGEEPLYLVEVKRDKSNSIVYNSDAKDYKEVENKWLNTKLNIKREDLEDGSKRYETTLVKNGVLYHLFGKIDENEFTEIVARMRF